jgi:50S ribosomal subunit-associated GTPase HflX
VINKIDKLNKGQVEKIREYTLLKEVVPISALRGTTSN